MVHAAFSCLYFRGLVEDLPAAAADASSDSTELFDLLLSSSATTIPPLDVKIEVMTGFILCLIGQIFSVGPLRPISGAAKLVAPSYVNRDFDSYDNRNQLLRK